MLAVSPRNGDFGFQHFWPQDQKLVGEQPPPPPEMGILDFTIFHFWTQDQKLVGEHPPQEMRILDSAFLDSGSKSY